MTQQTRSLRAAQSLHRMARFVLCLLVVFLLVYGYDSWRTVKEQEIRRMQTISLLMSRALDTYFQDKQAGLQSLADSLPLISGGVANLEAVRQHLFEFKEHRPEVRLVSLVRWDGQTLAASNLARLKDLPDISAVPTFQQYLRDYDGRDRAYIGRPQLGLTTGEWGFSIRYALKDRTGQPYAHINEVIPTDFLLSLWRDAPSFATRGMTLGVLRDDGYLLGRHPLVPGADLKEVYGTPRTGVLYKHLQEQRFPSSGVVEGYNVLANQTSFVNTFQRLQNFPVTVFVAQPSLGIFAAWFSTISSTLLLTALLALAVHMAARVLLRRESAWDDERERIDLQLRQSEREQRELIDRLMTGLVVHDHNGSVIRANVEASRLLGLTIEQMQGKQLIDPSWKFIQDDGAPMPVSMYPAAQVLTSRGVVKDLVVGVCKPGAPEPTWVLSRADPVFDDGSTGSIRQIVVTFVDITEKRRLGQELNYREARLKALFDSSLDAVLLTSGTGEVLSANPAACRLFRMSLEQMLRASRELLFDRSDERPANLMRACQHDGDAAGGLRMARADGSVFEAEVSASMFRNARAEVFMSMIIRDISERLAAQQALESANAGLLKANEQLAEMAHYDVLTHLPNRVLLGDRLRQAIAHSSRRGRALGVAFIDLDGFKEINDAHGHAVGDQMLVSLARRFKTVLREGDTLARIGGDEFVVVMTDLGEAQDCAPLVQRLLACAAEPVRLGTLMLRVSASIGVTVFPQDAAEAEMLLRHADQAMYQAKQAGKNRFQMFDVASNEAVRQRQDTLKAISLALERREFELYYQPQVQMRSGEVVGVEALLRWRHPQRGLLAPGLFLPAVEDHEFSIALGEMVIEQALEQMDQWQRHGLRIPVSINVFARQLQQPDFVQRLRAMLQRRPSVDPHHVKLEIVETNALEDVAQVSQLMRDCAELGVQFALDDFGTGYSSLTYLRSLPATLLKIDQTFVRDMLDDRSDLAIVQGVIGLARAFDREVIAEGVESAAHGRLLLQLGCELGQGYGIGRPMPADELMQWMALWLARQPWIMRPDAVALSPT